MEIESQISEDPEADELWQPIFEKKYSNLNQQLYSSPFKKFKLEEILRDDSKAKAILWVNFNKRLLLFQIHET